jgi:hypothetical protein
MLFTVYVRAEGPNSDVVAFHAKYGKMLGGEIREWRHTPDCGVYWKSREMTLTEGHPEDSLLVLLRELTPVMPTLDTPLKISAEIIAEYNVSEGPRGYYASPELIEALATLRADLDIDVYLHEGSVS